MIVAFESSAKDGSMLFPVRTPVTLLPSPDPDLLTQLAGPWNDEVGRLLPDGTDPEDGFALVVHSLRGAEHCGWQDIVFLHVAWPPGSVARSGDQFRQYVRDVDGVFGDRLATTFDSGSLAALPQDAAYWGFHRGDWELWAAGDDSVYLVNRTGGVVERWPRASTPILCA